MLCILPLQEIPLRRLHPLVASTLIVCGTELDPELTFRAAAKSAAGSNSKNILFNASEPSRGGGYGLIPVVNYGKEHIGAQDAVCRASIGCQLAATVAKFEVLGHQH